MTLAAHVQHALDTMPLTSAPKPPALGVAFVPEQAEHEVHAALRAFAGLQALDLATVTREELMALWSVARELEQQAAAFVNAVAGAADGESR